MRSLNIPARSPKGISEKNRHQLASINRAVRGPFTVNEVAVILGFDASRARRFLAYLAERGWIVRLRRGLYAPVALDAVSPGEWREDPWVVAAKVFGPSSYLGGWTACEHWSLTEQIFREIVVVTSRKLRRKQIEIQGVAFLAKRVPEEKIFGTNVVWRGQTRVYVSDPSRTVADVLDDPSIGGGIRHVADVLNAYIESEHRNDRLLIEYIRRVGNRSAFKRLGFLLETLKIRAPLLMRACQGGLSAGLSFLDPSMPGGGRILRRWNLRVNAVLLAESAAG